MNIEQSVATQALAVWSGVMILFWKMYFIDFIVWSADCKDKKLDSYLYYLYTSWIFYTFSDKINNYVLSQKKIILPDGYFLIHIVCHRFYGLANRWYRWINLNYFLSSNYYQLSIYLLNMYTVSVNVNYVLSWTKSIITAIINI